MNKLKAKLQALELKLQVLSKLNASKSLLMKIVEKILKLEKKIEMMEKQVLPQDISPVEECIFIRLKMDKMQEEANLKGWQDNFQFYCELGNRHDTIFRTLTKIERRHYFDRTN